VADDEVAFNPDESAFGECGLSPFFFFFFCETGV
jgi:hypothetical protein